MLVIQRTARDSAAVVDSKAAADQSQSITATVENLLERHRTVIQRSSNCSSKGDATVMAEELASQRVLRSSSFKAATLLIVIDDFRDTGYSSRIALQLLHEHYHPEQLVHVALTATAAGYQSLQVEIVDSAEGLEWQQCYGVRDNPRLAALFTTKHYDGTNELEITVRAEVSIIQHQLLERVPLLVR
jgi:hypothetical protein